MRGTVLDVPGIERPVLCGVPRVRESGVVWRCAAQPNLFEGVLGEGGVEVGALGGGAACNLVPFLHSE